MKLVETVRGLAVCAVALLLAGCGPAVDAPPTFKPSTPEEATKLAYFTGTVRPILRENCYRCHAGLNRKGGFNLSNRELLLKGGHHGAAVVPGQPETSLLVRLIRHQGPADNPMPMPQKGKLTDDQIAAITQWVADGAIMDR